MFRITITKITECKTFIHQLLEPKVELRMKIDEAARHRWIKKPGVRMKTHPFGDVDTRTNREIYRQISEVSGQTLMDVVAHIKADPFGSIAGMYNIKNHLHQMQASSIAELLWSSNTQEIRPLSPPEYIVKYHDPANSTRKSHSIQDVIPARNSDMAKSDITKPFIPKILKSIQATSNSPRTLNVQRVTRTGVKNLVNKFSQPEVSLVTNTRLELTSYAGTTRKDITSSINPTRPALASLANSARKEMTSLANSAHLELTRSPSLPSRPLSIYGSSNRNPPRPSSYGLTKPVFKVYDNGDGLDPRLPCIDEHSNTDVTAAKKLLRNKTSAIRRDLDETLRLNSCPNRQDMKRSELYRRAGDGLISWRNGVTTPTARILLQSNATTIKRASLGNIVSPHSSSNGHCKSERALPVGWFASRSLNKETHSQRLRRTALMK